MLMFIGSLESALCPLKGGFVYDSYVDLLDMVVDRC